MTKELEKKAERALLFIPVYERLTEEQLEDKVSEFSKLATSAGLEVIDVITQNIKDKRQIIGKGKVDEIALYIEENPLDCLLIDAPLISPSLEKRLSDSLEIKVLDRTNLILDIFAQRAKSNEGKIQVELAQLKYMLPRIMGQGLALSRLGGGVGTRGPGETKLETDRRHIRRRISSLEDQLKSVKRRREIQKQNRIKKDLPLVSLIGYTNSGKSTLLNKLSKDDIYAEDLLFATLDTTTRSIIFKESKNKILLTDTVGFISNLPHQLVSAFKSTLEEVLDADLLLHIVDISNPGWEEHIKVVNQVLDDLKALDKNMIYVLNKVDKINASDVHFSIDAEHYYISAQSGQGIEGLLLGIEKHFFSQKVLRIFIPYHQSRELALAHELTEVISSEHKEEGTELIIKAGQKAQQLLSPFITHASD